MRNLPSGGNEKPLRPAEGLLKHREEDLIKNNCGHKNQFGIETLASVSIFLWRGRLWMKSNI